MEGRTESEWGVLISGVGQASTSRQGGGFKARFGKTIGAAAALLHKEEAGMYRLSTDSREDQTKWVRQLMRCGIGGDIEEAQRIEAEKKQEQEEERRLEKERADAAAEAAADAWARKELLEGAGGDQTNSATNTFQQLGDAKMQVAENIQKLSEMADQTEEMRENASDFAAMARQMRQQQEKKSSRFGF